MRITRRLAVHRTRPVMRVNEGNGHHPIPPGPVPRTQPGLNLQEEGFEVAVVDDATAAAQLPEGDGDLAALINFRYLADARRVLEDVLCSHPVSTEWATPIF